MTQLLIVGRSLSTRTIKLKYNLFMGFNEPHFWQNFWPNFWADLIVGVVITGLISWIIRSMSKAEVRGTAEVTILDEASQRIKFAIRNTGRTKFEPNDVFWFVFMEIGFYSQQAIGFPIDNVERNFRQFYAGTTDIGGKTFHAFKGMTNAPIFPDNYLHIATGDFDRHPRDNFIIYYFLKTAYGNFPKGLKYDKDDNPLLETMGKLRIHLGSARK
jgi:hypothetical protein